MTVDESTLAKFFASFIVDYQATLPEAMPLEKKRKLTVADMSDIRCKSRIRSS